MTTTTTTTMIDDDDDDDDDVMSVVARLILTITNSVSSSLPLVSRNVRFLHVVFDSAGERFLAGDCQGNVFLFDIRCNK